MRSLRARLTLALGAVGLVVLSILDVAYVLSAQRDAVAAREVTLRAAGLEVAATVARGEENDALEEALRGIAERESVELRLEGEERTLRSSERALPDPPDGSYVLGGFAHVTVPAPPPWTRVVASQSLDITVDRVVATQTRVLPVLASTLIIMVLLGLWLLRRTVLQPIARMTEVVSAHDTDALATLEHDAVGDIAQLVRAVTSMRRRDDDARERIAQQLEELGKAHAELSATQRHLVRAERLAVVGQLAAGLAHELGNPLAVLSGYIDMAKSLEPHELEDALGRMEKELSRINNLVRNMLDFSRAQERARGRGDVVEACRHVRELLAPQEAFRGVEVHWSVPNSPVQVAVDTDAVTQVLLNLLLNAADALDSSGSVWVEVTPADGKVSVTVADDGPGLDEETKARVFEPFFTTKSAGKGTGLGLAVCEQIVSAAGGDIEVGDREGGGARFDVQLPT